MTSGMSQQELCVGAVLTASGQTLSLQPGRERLLVGLCFTVHVVVVDVEVGLCFTVHAEVVDVEEGL